MKFFKFFSKKSKDKIIVNPNIDYKKIDVLLDNALQKYNSKSCQCAFPRFIQIVSIDCFDYGQSFKSYETEILIKKSRKFFDSEKFENKQECHSEKWNCKKCNSEFELYWSDLSIALDRTTLKPINIKVKSIGKESIVPIPLYKGLYGYSYPPKTEIINVNIDEFENYILEK
ncbi:hypothetical protein PG630_08730 [Riemerella anatipestifer]|nr:hypothetical protein [Riemerella anatipestifer]